MNVRRTGLILVLSAAALSGCASHGMSRGPCVVGEPRSSVDLYFGLSVKDAPEVSDAQFADFLDREVTPRFPQGLTVIDAQGRWRMADGQIVREPSKIVQIVLPGAPDDLAKLDSVRDAYKRRFHQEAVLETIGKACAAF